MPRVDEILREMVKVGASDLHLKAGRPPLFRISGSLEELPEFNRVLTPKMTEVLAEEIMERKDQRSFRVRKNADFSYGINEVGRFRVNVFQQRGTTGLIFRTIPKEVPTIDGMDLPDVLRDLTNYHQGLILVTGPTGSGKSTTLAAMIDYINQNKKVHIITLEDPIEFYHADKTASINQREMGKDSPTFKDAMRGVLRQDPDVILLGEMRDQETIQTALTAAETGHLVFSTLHTNDAAQSITRISNTFPKSSRSHVLNQLGDALVAVISQQLVRRKEGGRAAAIEIMRNVPAISKLIKLGQPAEILPIVENSVVGEKMQSMNQSLCALWVNDVITEKEAMERSVYPDDLRQLYDKHFFIERYQAEKGEEPLTQVSGWATMQMKAELPDFANKLEELEYLRNLVGTTESRGAESEQELDRSSEKLQEELQWVKEQQQDMRRRLEELKAKVDEQEDDWKAKITKKDAEIRQLELKINRGKRDLLMN